MVDHRGMAARPVDGDDVESDPARWVLDGGQVGGGELAQAGALGRCHRLGGGSVAVAASGLDLAEHQQVRTRRDDVDLTGAAAPVARDDAEAEGGQALAGELLAPAADARGPKRSAGAGVVVAEVEGGLLGGGLLAAGLGAGGTRPGRGGGWGGGGGSALLDAGEIAAEKEGQLAGRDGGALLDLGRPRDPRLERPRAGGLARVVEDAGDREPADAGVADVGDPEAGPDELVAGALGKTLDPDRVADVDQRRDGHRRVGTLGRG